MKHAAKWIFAGAGIVALFGVILFACGIAMGAKSGFFLSKNGLTVVDESQIQEQTIQAEAFDSIRLYNDYGDVVFVPSDHYGLSFIQYTAFPASFRIENGVLIYSSSFKQNRGLMLNMPSFEKKGKPVTIYYPADAVFESIEIEADMGNVQLTTRQVERLKIECDLGNIILDGVQAKSSELSADLGDVIIRTPLSETDYSYECETDLGEVTINGASVGHEVKRRNQSAPYQMDVQADTGNISIEFGQ